MGPSRRCGSARTLDGSGCGRAQLARARRRPHPTGAMVRGEAAHANSVLTLTYAFDRPMLPEPAAHTTGRRPPKSCPVASAGAHRRHEGRGTRAAHGPAPRRPWRPRAPGCALIAQAAGSREAPVASAAAITAVACTGPRPAKFADSGPVRATCRPTRPDGKVWPGAGRAVGIRRTVRVRVLAIGTASLDTSRSLPRCQAVAAPPRGPQGPSEDSRLPQSKEVGGVDRKLRRG